MRTVIGIDLGSTTTKAVVLGEDGRTLGRGLTNTRSNYDVACAIAKSEALVATRFALFRERLEESRAKDAPIPEVMAEIERCFRLEQHLGQLNALRDEMETAAADGAGTAAGAGSSSGRARSSTPASRRRRRSSPRG